MNYTKQIFLTAFIIISALFITSCNKQFDEPQPINETDISLLGKKLENPYSVENMGKAFENLKQNDKSGIITSHLYIKFKPKNEDDLNLIKKDSTLNLFNYPLDYEAVEGQEAYRDPEVPTNQPTYLYASIKVDYKIPSVEYEILEELFIPEEIDDKKNDSFYVDELVYEALRITNNLDYDEHEKASKWRPAGRIKLWDKTKNQYVFPDGLKVRATRWFTTHRGFVNTNGYYSCDGRFRGKARYRIDWERYNFALRDGFWNSAQYTGPYKRGDWNWTIYNGNVHQFYGTIFRAAFHYYYKNIKGLRRPPLNSFWHVQLRIQAKNETNSSNGTHCASCRFLGLGSAIKIYNPQNDSEDIYATTIHELAHASHWNMSSWHYNNGDDIVVESWARGVQWELTRMVYSSYQATYARLNYTGIVQDMIDGYGTKGTSYWWDYDEETWGSPNLYKSYYDQVTGYSIRQIEDALVGERYWNNWKNDIKNSYNNGTENNLDNSFDFWNTY